MSTQKVILCRAARRENPAQSVVDNQLDMRQETKHVIVMIIYNTFLSIQYYVQYHQRNI